MLASLGPFVAGNGGPAVDRLFNDPFFQPFLRQLPQAALEGARTPTPAADVLETARGIELRLDVPGHDPGSIQVQLEGDTLTVRSERREADAGDGQRVLRSERRHGVFARSFVLPKHVDGARAEAGYEHGVLTIRLPMREEAKPRTIDVKVHG